MVEVDEIPGGRVAVAEPARLGQRLQVEHLYQIVADARIFHRRWGRWPMPGWLDAFERDGLISPRGDEIAVTPASR
jgi:hypothetical protein